VLNRVEKIISRRAAPRSPEKRLEFLLDEYFFQANRSNALWARGAFRKGMAHARKAFALEKTLRERTRGTDALIEGLGFRAEHVYSTGSWALISMLTGLKKTREAQEVFEALLEEDEVMEARFPAHRENAEMMLVAGICAYTAPREQKRLAPGGRQWKLMTRRCPAPSTPHLAYAYACLHAVSGKGDEALLLLGWALKLGFSKQLAREDPDLASLRGNQKFRKLTGYSEP
jgi:hypothetical protein